MIQRKKIVRPAFLKEGDKVALVSPAYWIPQESIQEAAETVKSWGLHPVIGPHTNSLNVNVYAGTADERVSDILWALKDDSIKAAPSWLMVSNSTQESHATCCWARFHNTKFKATTIINADMPRVYSSEAISPAIHPSQAPDSFCPPTRTSSCLLKRWKSRCTTSTDCSTCYNCKMALSA